MRFRRKVFPLEKTSEEREISLLVTLEEEKFAYGETCPRRERIKIIDISVYYRTQLSRLG